MPNIASTDDSVPASPPQLTQRPNEHLSKLSAVHTVFGFFIGLLITLVGIKYLGTGINPFETDSWIMALSICALFVYSLTMLSEMMVDTADNFSYMFTFIYHVSGLLAVELLGYVILGPLVLILMNPFSLLLLELIRRRRRRSHMHPPAHELPIEQPPALVLKEIPTANTKDPQVCGEVSITI